MVLTEDQRQFKEVVTRFFADKSPATEVRRLMQDDAGYDRAVWQTMSQELGLSGLHIPEQLGGYGFGFVELSIVLDQMGRHLYCGPFFGSSVMATFAVLAVADQSKQQQIFPALADGSEIACLVIEDVGDYQRWGSQLRASKQGISGDADVVLDAGIASQLFVIAGSDRGLTLFQVAPDSPGVTIESREVIDPTRKVYRVRFDQVSGIDLGTITPRISQTIWHKLCLCLSVEMLGGAQYLLDTTIEYTKLRYQFGRPIGSFQGLKHRCADLLMELELARGVVDEAITAAAEGGGDDYLPAMAKAMASDAYVLIAKAAIQLRGGIGFTWENDTHLWFKRAKSSEVFLGTPAFHREQMIQMIEEADDAA